MKQYSLINRVIPSTLWDVVEQLVFVAGSLTNFQPRLAAQLAISLYNQDFSDLGWVETSFASITITTPESTIIVA